MVGCEENWSALEKKNSKDQGQINAVVGFWEVLNVLFFWGSCSCHIYTFHVLT